MNPLLQARAAPSPPAETAAPGPALNPLMGRPAPPQIPASPYLPQPGADQTKVLLLMLAKLQQMDGQLQNVQKTIGLRPTAAAAPRPAPIAPAPKGILGTF